VRSHLTLKAPAGGNEIRLTRLVSRPVNHYGSLGHGGLGHGKVNSVLCKHDSGHNSARWLNSIDP
jgi:hypothetical protein